MKKQKKYRTLKKHSQKHNFSLNAMQQLFSDLLKRGDQYACTACHQTFYQHSVYLATKSYYQQKHVKEDILDKCFTGVTSVMDSEWICKTCHKYVLMSKIPPMSVSNGFLFPDIPDIIQKHKPTQTEERCCSLRIPFMQIKQLGFGKQCGIYGNTVNVPMNPSDVIQALPRRMDDTAIIQLHFMRKTSYKRPIANETIVQKLFLTLPNT